MALPKLPLAPLAGAVNVTVTPPTGLFPASFTIACSCIANAVLIVALCGVPAVEVIETGAPAVLVKGKVAGFASPPAVAETL
jgi:hypothetical protein